jgi:hypothetical protein
MTSRRSLVGILTLLGGIGSVILAPAVLHAEPPCAPDVRALCPDVPIGGGRIQECLKAQEAKLSEPCRRSVDELVRQSGALMASCRWDISRFCSDVAPGGTRVLACLGAHNDDLSPVCRTQLNPPKDKP